MMGNQLAYSLTYSEVGRIMRSGRDGRNNPESVMLRNKLRFLWDLLNPEERKPFLAPGVLDLSIPTPAGERLLLKTRKGFHKRHGGVKNGNWNGTEDNGVRSMEGG